jgi:gluconokinase
VLPDPTVRIAALSEAHRVIVVVMGVTGVGKTTVGRLLARALGAEFVDGDDYHPAANVAKMHAGTPLTDDDRRPWLARLNEVLLEHAARNAGVVLACSALKQRYREQLFAGVTNGRLVYLRGTKAMLAERLGARREHFMNPALLDSQFAALEEPTDAIAADVDRAPEAIAATILAQLSRS